MTTDKTRCTIYLRSTRELDDLVEECRRAVPLELRGRITRSTATEAAVAIALAELRANGKQSAVLAALVALPRVETTAKPAQVQDDGAETAQNVI